MFSFKFIESLKRHQRFFKISLFLILIYFVGNALITPKITSVAESLLEDIIKENRSSKRNSLSFEFNRLHLFFKYSEERIREYSDVSSTETFEELKKKLLYTTEFARSNPLISNSFLYSITPGGIEEIHLENKEASFTNSENRPLLSRVKPLQDELVIDTILTSDKIVLHRKVFAKKLNADTTIVVGYDINLLDFWEYYAETSRGGSGYTVLSNEEGICILHPEKEYIGQKLEGFFDVVPISTILQQENVQTKISVKNTATTLKDKAISSFLGLEVLRYFEVIKIGEKPLILIENFPVDINLKETTKKIKDYFSWISLLAFLTFMLLLLASRLQLKKEYTEKLKAIEEKEQLLVANETYQKENAVLQLNQLKEKMKPHFLFNSLNSLQVLIETKPDVSQEFVFRLANVYRYLLENKEGNLISIKEEIHFLDQYIFLQKIRFNSSLNLTITNTCKDVILFKKIPFLALQTLVENAIKHNEITKDNPLSIEITIEEEVLIVANNYTPRKNKNRNSHYLGLTYLENIYKHHQIDSFKVEVIHKQFRCHLPLLS